jgi:hypothetical protein
MRHVASVLKSIIFNSPNKSNEISQKNPNKRMGSPESMSAETMRLNFFERPPTML